jgi:hypothetical protein
MGEMKHLVTDGNGIVARVDVILVYQAPLVVEQPGLDGSPMPQKIRSTRP